MARSRSAAAQEAAASAGLPNEVLRELQDLGLSSYEAAVLLALIQLGSASTLQLAGLSKVPRSSCYGILEELRTKGLAERLEGDGPAMFASPGRDEVFAQLEALQEQRLEAHRARATRTRQLLDQAIPTGQTPTLPFARLIHDRAQAKRAYEQILGAATTELLVFNRPPYTWQPNPTANRVVVDTLRRGVPTRVLYQAIEVDDPDLDGWHQEMDAYHQAGAQGRVVAELPTKLVVVDRRYALMTLDTPDMANIGFPTAMYVEHHSFAAVQALAFEHLWTTAAPYPAT